MHRDSKTSIFKGLRSLPKPPWANHNSALVGVTLCKKSHISRRDRGQGTRNKQGQEVEHYYEEVSDQIVSFSLKVTE